VDDHSVLVFDDRTAKLRVALRGHTGPIERMGFSPDGRFLATASDDSTARVWDVAIGETVASVRVPDVLDVSFSPDGRSLLLHAPRRVLLWRCYACGDRAALMREVEARKIVRPISDEERRRLGIAPD
jgi:WD40 repeat protein